jgi:porin
MADDEEGRLPGIPEHSIATSLPQHLADPGGMRSRLARYGIQFGVSYIGEVLGNPSGGFKQSTHYDGRLELVFEIDMEKMIGWKGLTFFANGYQIHGTSISADNLGVLMPVSFIEATPATRLFELYFDQKLFNDKVSVRFGQLAADSEFILSDGAGAFLNGTWGWPSITAEAMPNGGPAYPLATPGVRVAFNPNDQVALLVGLFNGNPAGPCGNEDPQVCNPHGLDFRISDPPLLMVEGAYKYNQGGGQLPGTIKFGGWRQWGDFETLRDPDRVIHGDYGLYAIIDQMIYRLPGEGDPKGISVFGRVIGAPSDRNVVDIYWEAGMTFSGMMPSRPNDILGIGFAYTGISDDESARQRADGEPVISDYEALIEIAYTIHVIPGWTVQPDFQYFWNPGGHAPDPDDDTKAIPNAAVFGLRTSINY